MGIIQEVRYYEDGAIQLEAANGGTYCSTASPPSRMELVALLEQPELVARLRDFGKRLRYPECFIQEEVTIAFAGLRVTARVDALEGELLSLVEQLDEASRGQFGQKHMISLVERAAEQECKPAGP